MFKESSFTISQIAFCCEGSGDKLTDVGWSTNLKRDGLSILVLRVCDRKLSNGKCTLPASRRQACKIGNRVLSRASYNRVVMSVVAPQKFELKHK